jgi:acetyltransferase-like isoleucine patch superfamily enzyme
VNLLKHLLFVVQQRRAGNRVSLAAYIKGHEGIRLGRGCKIQADASVDATRSPGVRFGDKVEINRYAYVQGGNGGVRIADRVRVNNFAIINGSGGVDIGEDTLIVIMAGVSIGDGAVVAAGAVVREDVPEFTVVAGVPATVRKART